MYIVQLENQIYQSRDAHSQKFERDLDLDRKWFDVTLAGTLSEILILLYLLPNKLNNSGLLNAIYYLLLAVNFQATDTVLTHLWFIIA